MLTIRPCPRAIMPSTTARDARPAGVAAGRGGAAARRRGGVGRARGGVGRPPGPRVLGVDARPPVLRARLAGGVILVGDAPVGVGLVAGVERIPPVEARP